MFQKELLMWLSKYGLTVLLLIFLSGCISNSIFYNKELSSLIYINSIPEKRGMIIRNKLLEYFPNQDQASTDYIINISSQTRQDNYLTERTGFASKTRITTTLTWNIVYKPTNVTILSLSNTYTESFNIESTGQSNIINANLSEEIISKTIAKDISMKTFSFLQKVQENPYILGFQNNDSISLSNLYYAESILEYDLYNFKEPMNENISSQN